MRKCLKCGFVSREPIDPLSCPQCGAVYAKVEAAAQAGAAIRPPAPARSSRFEQESTFRRAEPTHPRFIDRLRRETLYPTFRNVVKVFYILLLVVAAAAVIGAVVSGSGAAIAGAVTGSALLVVFASFMREGMLMAADLSDATVRMAERQDGNATEMDR